MQKKNALYAAVNDYCNWTSKQPNTENPVLFYKPNPMIEMRFQERVSAVANGVSLAEDWHQVIYTKPSKAYFDLATMSGSHHVLYKTLNAYVEKELMDSVICQYIDGGRALIPLPEYQDFCIDRETKTEFSFQFYRSGTFRYGILKLVANNPALLGFGRDEFRNAVKRCLRNIPVLVNSDNENIFQIVRNEIYAVANGVKDNVRYLNHSEEQSCLAERSVKKLQSHGLIDKTIFQILNTLNAERW